MYTNSSNSDNVDSTDEENRKSSKRRRSSFGPKKKPCFNFSVTKEMLQKHNNNLRENNEMTMNDGPDRYYRLHLHVSNEQLAYYYY
ncbi:hypothetical protein ACI65C_010353 [Semiaphis heraclei]